MRVVMGLVVGCPVFCFPGLEMRVWLWGGVLFFLLDLKCVCGRCTKGRREAEEAGAANNINGGSAG